MIIIDGNNVMGQRVGWHRNKPAAQHKLIDEVDQRARSTNEPHILVFDGKPDAPLTDKWSRSALTVRYARPVKSADELILELVYEYARSARVSVVTSDRALARQAGVLGANVIRSGAFRKLLEQSFIS